MTPRKWLAASGILIAVLAGFLSVGSPRVLLLNNSLRIEYPWPRGLAAVMASVGVVLVAMALSKLAFRLIGIVLALGVALVAFHLLRYRLDATDAGLVSRGVLGITTIAWRDIGSVERGPDLLLIKGPDGALIRVDTTDFTAEQQASLERTVARHVREAGGDRVIAPALPPVGVSRATTP